MPIRTMQKGWIIGIVGMLLIAPFVAADSIIINSDDWRDVYSGMLYGTLTGTPTNFLVSDRHATLILNSIPRSTPVEVFSSKKNPYIVGYESVLQSKGYEATETQYTSFNLEL